MTDMRGGRFEPTPKTRGVLARHDCDDVTCDRCPWAEPIGTVFYSPQVRQKEIAANMRHPVFKVWQG